MRCWFTILTFLLVLAADLKAQDYQFSQFYAIPLYYNPAFAGANLKSRGILAYRSQWPGLGGWKGYAASFDGFLKNASSGAGVCLSQNFLSSLGYSNTSAMAQYSYRARWRKDVRVCAGIGLGLAQFSWNPSGLLFGDQLENDPVASRSRDPLASGSVSALVFDMQLGILFYSKSWWASLSGLHPHSPGYNLLTQNTLDPRINVSGGYRFIIKKRSDYKNQETPVSLTPALLIRSQSNVSQLDAGLYYHYPPFVWGVWYRGVPVPAGKLKIINQDAATLLAGIKQNNITIGYSYDVPLSRIVGLLRGSHEITVSYEFSAKNISIRNRQHSRALPCPTF